MLRVCEFFLNSSSLIVYRRIRWPSNGPTNRLQQYPENDRLEAW